MTEESRDLQGHDVSGDVFKNEGAVLQAAEEPACGGYKAQTTFSAAAAAGAVGGLEGKVVVDLMARTGMGIRALAPYNPSLIRAFELQTDMQSLIRATLWPHDVVRTLEELNAEEVLGHKLYKATAVALARAQDEFAGGLFRTCGGNVSLETNVPTSRRTVIGLTKAHVAIGNSWLHWEVNRKRKQYAYEGQSSRMAFKSAFADAMGLVHEVLRPKGVAVFLTPIDFVWDSRDPERQALLESRTMINHPVARAMMAGISERFKALGADLPALQTSHLFRQSAMPRLFQSVGFELLKTCVWEGTFGSTVPGMDAIDAFFVRYPLWTGKVSSDVVSPAQKHKIATEVVAELRRRVLTMDLWIPIRGYYTAWVARKQ